MFARVLNTLLYLFRNHLHKTFSLVNMQQRFFHLLRSFITLINLSELYYFDLLIQCYFEIYEFLAFPKYPENCPLEFSRNDSRSTVSKTRSSIQFQRQLQKSPPFTFTASEEKHCINQDKDRGWVKRDDRMWYEEKEVGGNKVERLIPWAHDVNRRYIKRRGRLLNV